MFINQVIYKKYFPKYNHDINIQDRYINYFNDLHSRFNFPLDKLSIKNYSYRHHELGNKLFELMSNKFNFRKCDYVLFPSWGVPFDPDYATHELHYKHKFNIESKMIDVRDCGSLCVFRAIDLASDLMRSECNKAILSCSIETKGSPAWNKMLSISPELNYISAIEILKESESKKLTEIICIKIKNNIINSDLWQAIKDILCENNIEAEDCTGFARAKNNLFMLGEINHNLFEFIFKIKWEPIYFKPSSGFVCYCLDQLINSKVITKREYIIIIDQDAESHSVALLILKLHHEKNHA